MIKNLKSNVNIEENYIELGQRVKTNIIYCTLVH